MPAVKVGVREFREQVARFLESDTPIAVTRRGETLGIYVPTPRKGVRTADAGELRAAADRLAEALAGMGGRDRRGFQTMAPRTKRHCPLT